MELQAHQQRVVEEKTALDEKNAKLTAFIATETFQSLDPVDRKLLLLQNAIMENYSSILGQRIARF